MNILVINGHKYYPFSEGRLNRTLFNEIVRILEENGQNIRTTIIENGYDIGEEVEKFKWADMIIFQSPVNWFSVPWLLKKYIDEVYQHGIFYTGSEKYGDGGLFKEKKYMFSMTCNASEEAFYNISSPFFECKSPDDIIIALHKLHQYCAMKPVRSFFCFDVIHNPVVEKYLKALANHLHIYVLNDRLS